MNSIQQKSKNFENEIFTFYKKITIKTCFFEAPEENAREKTEDIPEGGLMR